MNRGIRLLLAALLLGTSTYAAAEPMGPDGDGDGVVTFEEFQAFRLARAFANDADGDGALTLEEFRPMLPQRVPRMMHGRAFGRIDADADGLIVPEELDAAPARAFEQADADGNGRLSGDELSRLRSQ